VHIDFSVVPNVGLIKLSTETLDEYIEKFDNIISCVRAQQEPSQRWDELKSQLALHPVSREYVDP
jgi:hypothetical protein